MESETQLAAMFEALFPHLDERQRRLLAGAEARAVGHGGIRVVARAAGMREGTVSRGVAELDAGEGALGRVRRPGGGRKRLTELDPGLRAALMELVEPDVRGDPTSPLRWTTKSTRSLARELTGAGHRCSADVVADVLREEGFSLQGNAKTIEGRQHPDRDAQFRHINEQTKAFQAAGDPVVSVDAKKKELVGPFKNTGRTWRPKGDPVAVRTHDFMDNNLGKVTPYGVYDIAANRGWVNVGTDHDTAAFAVESVRRWWNGIGRRTYPGADRLLITADGGGSNGYRTWAWKHQLAALAEHTGLTITVTHFPPGTSKWNRIEHRLFSAITMNWRGRPLTSHEVIIQSIAATTTSTGLRVHAELDTGSYPTGATISKEQIAALPIVRDPFHGDWNYTLLPARPATRTPAAPRTPVGTGHLVRESSTQPALAPARLRDPRLTGITEHELDQLITTLTGPLAAHREQRLHERRGAERQCNPGAGRHQRFTDPDRILAALLHARGSFRHALLGTLFGIDTSTCARIVRQITPLLAQHAPAIPRSTARFTTPDDITAYLTDDQHTHPAKIKPAC